ncbi:MAG: hypothetical protein SGI73_04880 [Chloroflexota bacterium]|nr:hypothetical protein [Chloroflexota bacterium]
MIQRNNAKTYPRPRVYLLGIAAGAIYGLVGAYFYARAHEEDLKRGDAGNRVQTSELITVAVAALAMVRQIAEMGRAPNRTRRR